MTIVASDLTAPSSRSFFSGGRGRAHLLEPGARGVAAGSGGVVIIALGGVAIFLTAQGWPAMTATTGLPQQASNLWELGGPLAFGSVWVSALALLLTAPVAVGVALFLSEYAPKRLARVLAAVVDVLAAVPSVVIGLWGLMVLAPALAGPYAWLSAHLGWFPLFAGEPSATGRTIMTASIVLAIMMTPIMAAVCREAFVQTPSSLREAATALGSTRWEVIKLAVLPYGRSAIISGGMLGLGRALGETMAVAMVLSARPGLISFQVLTSSNPNTVAAFIAQNFPEAHGVQVNALIALGLVLFVISFAVNGIARRVAQPKQPTSVTRRRHVSSHPDGVASVRPSEHDKTHRPLVTPAISAAPPHVSLTRRIKAQTARVVIGGLFLAAVVPLVSLIATVISRGVARFDLTFLTSSMRGVVGAGGGALHAIVGTLLITAATVLIAAPLGVAAAVYLVEYGQGRMKRLLTFLVDVMTGIPSIVASLFAYAVFSAVLGPGTRSGVAGALALAVLMVPVVIRSSEEMLRLVPSDLREAALALGSPVYRMIMRVVLPTAAPGIVSGVMLGTCRIVGETAPLLLVAGFTDSMNFNLGDGRMTTLPVFIYNQWQNAGQDRAAYEARAWAGALVLIIIVLATNLAARLWSSRKAHT